MEYKFRKFEKSDYDFVYKVKKDAYQKYVEQYFGVWDEELQQKFFKDYVDKQKDSIKIIVVDGKDVGFFDAFVTRENVFEIANICIVPQFQGKGIGTKILKEAILNCTQKVIDIQCFISNPVQNLYERLGFVEYERTKTHIKMRLKKENMMHSSFIILVATVIVEDGKVLLVEEQKESVRGLLNFPAGHLEENESLVEACIRETKEETGFDVEIIDFLETKYLVHKGNNYISFVFRGKLKSNKEAENAELKHKFYDVDFIRNNPDKLRNVQLICSALDCLKGDNALIKRFENIK